MFGGGIHRRFSLSKEFSISRKRDQQWTERIEYLQGMEKSRMNYTYILECADGTYYTGWTNDLEKRVQDHNEKKGAKYTRGRTPVRLVYREGFETKKEALQREAAIKRLSRAEKEALIAKQNKEIYGDS